MSEVLPPQTGSVAAWTERYGHALMDTFGPPQRVLSAPERPETRRFLSRLLEAGRA